MKLSLPEPDAKPVAEVRDWLARFAACVPEGTAAVRPFCSRHRDLRDLPGTGEESVGLDRAAMGQCLAGHGGFFASIARTPLSFAAPAGALTVASVPGTSTGFHEGGRPFERPGRAMIVLPRQADSRWPSVHSHMSLTCGVPQDSHGKRAVQRSR